MPTFNATFETTTGNLSFRYRYPPTNYWEISAMSYWRNCGRRDANSEDTLIT